MIPKIIHFILVGSDLKGNRRPFRYFHYLAIKTAIKAHQPDEVMFHCDHEPDGLWWAKAKPLLNVNRLEAPGSIFGNEIRDPAHQADVIRLEQLLAHGGMYSDLDSISINSAPDLWKKKVVMGRLHQEGLGNGVILSEPNAEFLKIWLESYHNFDDKNWSRHSVQLPAGLSQKHPELIHILDEYQFYFPMYNDPSQLYLWWTLEDFANFRGKIQTEDPVYLSHLKNGRDWQLARLKRSICLHLWEQAWYDKYLAKLDPDYIMNTLNNFSLLMKELLSAEEIAGN